jgi:tetratricopeptide (TPR) repeat protein
MGPSILFWYGQLLTLFRRKSRALEVFRMVVTRGNPRHQRAWSCIGFLLAEREEFQPALDAFERALALNPANAASHFNIAFILQRIGRHDEAIARFERALEADAKVDRAWYGLGLSLARLGRFEEAAAKFREAARLQPSKYERIKGFDPKVAERIRVESGVQPK